MAQNNVFSPLIIFSILLSFVLYTIYLASKKPGSLIDRFTSKMTVITGFLAAFGIYLTYKIFQAQVENLSNDITLRLIDRSWVDVNELIYWNVTKCPTLVNSLYYSWQKPFSGNNSNNSNNSNNDIWTSCNYLSIKMFQAWEDYLTLAGMDETGAYVWIANFLQWTHSKELEKEWNALKANFSKTTIEFGDFLFKSSREYTPKNADDHLAYAIKLSESEVFKNIKIKRSGVTTYAIV
jgi:hypothetical protein